MNSGWAQTKNRTKNQTNIQAKTILGLDPGSHHTGFGVIEVTGSEICHIAHGVISAPSLASFNSRLHYMAQEISKVFVGFKPHITVVERIFLGRNADSAFKLGHIRGVCLLAAAQADSQIVEYAARSVKKGITGSGAATKEQVQLVLFASLGLVGSVQVDASDALALACFHARQLEVEELMSRHLRPATT